MAPTPFQIAVDCADPHRQVRFWAAAMGLQVEHHDDLIRGLIDSGQVTDDEVTELDGHLQFRTAAACSDVASGTRLLFQQVPEPKSGKNRVHLDLRVGEEGRAGEVERLIGLGATRLWDGQQGPNRWVTMADPEGNEFCVA